MINVLLVDDNYYALEYLKNLIDWEANGFCIVTTALDGEEAIKKYKKYIPELVITDVKMPIVSGIELASAVKAINKKTYIIFLSSYENFDYARSAMALGIHNYILKHEIDEASLMKQLNEIKMQLEVNDDLARNTIENDLLYLINHSNKNNINKNNFRNIVKKYNQFYNLLMIEQDHYLPVFAEKFQIETSEFDTELVKKICYDLSVKVQAVIKTNQYQYLLLYTSEKKENINDFPYQLKSELNLAFEKTCSVFVISENQRLETCINHYQERGNMVNQKYFTSNNCIIHYNFYQDRKVENLKFDRQFILNALENHDLETIFQTMDVMYKSIIKEKDYYACNVITQAFLSVLEEKVGKLIDLKTGQIFKLYHSFDQEEWYLVVDAILWLKKKYSQIGEILLNNKNYQYSREVMSAIKYIYKHYDNASLSIEEIARQTLLSVNRLSVVFKNEVDITLVQFLTEYRIEKAKKLLGDQSVKISEVHKLIGYTTTQYFTRVFKKVCNMTPLEYRRSRLGHDSQDLY